MLQVRKPALAASPKSVDLPPMEPTPDGETVHTLAPSTPLPQAMARLLHMGVAALPVVDNNGMLLDLYARADVVRLTTETRTGVAAPMGCRMNHATVQMAHKVAHRWALPRLSSLPSAHRWR